MKLNFTKMAVICASLSASALFSTQVSAADSWGPLVQLRDDSALFPDSKPTGGWWVTPIHATLLTDGKLLITGWGRRDHDSCGSGGTRKTGTSFILDPNTLPNGGTLNIQPISEAPAAGTTDVAYCAGHAPLYDGRILYSGGSRYEDLGGPNQKEYGLNYSRLYSPTSNSFSKVSFSMLGGLAGMEGLTWYPTNTRLADGKMLVVGGFSRCCDATFSNRTLQTFDINAQDQGQNPWTLVSSHDAAPLDMNPGLRDYIHSFLLPQAVNVAGIDRNVAFMASSGRVVLASTDTSVSSSQRFVTATNGQRAFNAGGWDSTAALVSTGEIMTAGGTDDVSTAQRIDLYNPVTSSARTIDTGIGRRNASSVLLPDGTVLLVNGGNDERNYAGDRRSPQIVNLETGTVTTLNPWPNDTLERGYHSFAILLKDGRVLIGGGISSIGGIACERPDLRVYNPPYLANGTRPVVSNAPASISMTTGGSTVALTYSGEVLKTSAQGGVVLMAMGSTTHSFDQNQRYVKLPFTQSGNALTITPPANTQIAPPGDYMLFVVAQTGAPSVGIPVRIEKSQVVTPKGFTVPGTIQVEDYNRSFDTTAGNTGAAYRSDSVDIEATTDTNGGFNVGWTDTGEWLEYDLNVTAAGTYSVDVRVASAVSTGQFSVAIDGVTLGGVQTVASSGGWQTWKTQTVNLGNLTQGSHVLRLQMPAGGVNFNWVQLNKSFSASSLVSSSAPSSTPKSSVPTTSTPTSSVPTSSLPTSSIPASSIPASSSAVSSSLSGVVVPGVIQVEDYKRFFDATAGNTGGAYRSDNVDIEATTDTNGGFNVGWTDNGEWLEYDVNVTSAGTYNVDVRVASALSTGQFSIAIDGVILGGVQSVTSSGGWQTWKTQTFVIGNLTQGSHVLRLQIPTGGVNLNWIQLIKTQSASSLVSSSSAPVSSVPPSSVTTSSTPTSSIPSSSLPTSSIPASSIPASSSATSSLASSAAFTSVVEAESYVQMSGIQTETTTDTGGGLNVGYIDANDWMKYAAVNIPVAGTYTVEYRVASQPGGGVLQLEESGGSPVYGTVNIGATGGWQTWTTVKHTITLTAGSHSFAIKATNGGWNINWFRVTQGIK